MLSHDEPCFAFFFVLSCFLYLLSTVDPTQQIFSTSGTFNYQFQHLSQDGHPPRTPSSPPALLPFTPVNHFYQIFCNNRMTSDCPGSDPSSYIPHLFFFTMYGIHVRQALLKEMQYVMRKQPYCPLWNQRHPNEVLVKCGHHF